MGCRLTDKKYKRFKKRTVVMFEYWLKVFGLDNTWVVELYLDRGGFSGSDAAMETTCDWQYLWANIHVSVPQCIDEEDGRLSAYMCHEMLHIALAGQTQHPSPEMHEHTTSQLAHAFMRLKGMMQEPA